MTDDKGRYNFLNVPLGTHAVRLDPATTPYPPLVLPSEGGLNGTQQVHVRGLTSVDFPLAPLGGDVDVIRRTSLVAGPLTVSKVVFKTQDGYVVNLHLSSTERIEGLRLNDPLPAGATLREGQPLWQGTLEAGQTTLSYRFNFDGEPRSAVTDPVVDWRY
ncbi:hypothetical protein ACFP81_07125 [Deinococcus lacus]|uniref:Carboxypeptidase regulatory-like domain-containing protein n=1 Tax=Deinococcus lacus TaxID=392561 RepID=A0ABW1YE61_9DEIO